jgi:dynein heavy chain
VGYSKEIESYDNAGDVEDRDNMAAKVTELSDNLVAAVTESEDINIQEKLFGWAPTKFGQIATYANQLEPYRKLWAITQAFFKNIHAWLNGPFSHLDPEDIEVGLCTWNQVDP